MSKNPTALYLHGGPGLNCAVERAWFGDNYPVAWWDQPRFSADAENAYQTTLNAAAEKLTELHAQQGQPVHIHGWSFGARLALDLAHRTPETIDTLTLLAPSLCLKTAFDRMARYLARKGESLPALPSPAHSSDNRERSHERFMQQAISVLSIPNLFSYYWAPASGSQFARHSAEITSTNWFDLDTFTTISRDIIERPIAPLSAGQISKIRIFAGRYDPFFDRQSDPDFWSTIFPGASIRIEESGHMLPFEISATEWLNSSSTAPAKGNSPRE